MSTRRDGKRIYYDIDDQMDERVDRVLNATLNSMVAEERGESVPVHRPVDTKSSISNQQADTFSEPYMSDWKPNELEVFLL